MAVRGRTVNVALSPIEFTDTDGIETIVPSSIVLRNGTLSDQKRWTKRPGMAENWDTGATARVDGLIPLGLGYALTDDGGVHRLGTTPTTLSGTTSGQLRPSVVNFDEFALVARGGTLTRINGNTVEAVSGSPPEAKFLAVINGRVVAAGHLDKQLRWTDAGSHTVWDTANTTEISPNSGHVRNISALNNVLYVFTDNSVEIWANTGGTLVFSRNTTAPTGCGADYSVIQANSTHYWLGDGGDFYALNGAQPTIISPSHSAEIRDVVRKDDCYGFDFRRENVIRWFFPTDGKCFVYDYLQGFFSQDNAWDSGFTRLPIAAHMEMDGGKNVYVGDYDPTGKVYSWSTKNKTDAGEPIRVYRKFLFPLGGSEANGNQHRLNRAQFRVKTAVANADEPTPQFVARFKFDQEPFGQEFTYDLGEVGTSYPYIEEENVGVGREVEMELWETDATDFLVTDLRIRARDLGR